MNLDMRHWRGFRDFVWMEGLAGGPSANIKVMAQVAKNMDLTHRDLKWLCGCYAAIYNSPSAYGLFMRLPLEHVLGSSEAALSDELASFWQYIPIHSNRRRTCGIPRKLAASLKSLAAWADTPKGMIMGYAELWEEVSSINTVGRYFGIKLAGIMHRVGLTAAQQYDIRAKGAKNGRRTLGYLFPDELEVADHHNNRKDVLVHAEELANIVMGRLVDNGLDISWFELETLLCEYNQCVKGKRYPGKTSDADLSATYHAHQDPDVPMDAVFQARQETHPTYALGEKEGWDGKREGLLKLYAERGYMWSDAIYDYSLTTDLAAPVVRDGSLVERSLTAIEWRKA